MRQRYNLSFRREQQKKDRIKKLIVIVILLFIFAALGVLIYFAYNNVDWGSAFKGIGKDSASEKKEDGIVNLTINAAGEVIVYDSQLSSAENDDDGYDFSDAFKYIKKYVKKGDLSLFDLETTLSGEPYSTSTRFNAPDQLAEALKDTGFNVAVTGNEHALDTGEDGVRDTLDALDEAGLKSTGTVKDSEDKNYLIQEVKGIKVGIVSYTQETSESTDSRSLDNVSRSEDEMALVNSYSNNNLEEDLESVKDSIDDAKADGAQVIVCYFSWGENYDGEANDNEKEIAEQLVDMGADVIFGTHPRVLQEKTSIKNKDGIKVPVFYSLGNFYSNQRQESVGDSRTERGALAQVKVNINKSSGKIEKIKSNYVPIWMDRYFDSSENDYAYGIIPLVKNFQDNEFIESSGNSSRAEEALSEIYDKLGKTKYVKKSDIQSDEDESDEDQSEENQESDG